MAPPPGSIFHAIANLRNMSPGEAAAAIAKWHLSPLVVAGALAGAAKESKESSAVIQATIAQMSDTETVTRAASLQAAVARDAGTRETFRNRIAKAAKSAGTATLKAGHKADEIEDDGMREMLRELQNRQIASAVAAGRGIDGNWLLIVDCSRSQEIAINLGRHVAAAVSKFVTGNVMLVFCNAEARPYNCTGKTLEQITYETRNVTATGGTSYGVGLDWAVQRWPRADTSTLPIDGVILIGDGGENSAPLFHAAWSGVFNRYNVELPVHFFQTYCAPEFARMSDASPDRFEAFMGHAGLSQHVTKHDMRGAIDYFSVPNIVQQIKVSRFSLAEQIMACPLLTLDHVLGK